MTGPRRKQLPPAIDLAAAVERAVNEFSDAAGGLVLIGGVALQAYGIVRSTKDVDFAVSRAGSTAVEKHARALGLPVSPLRIGGVSVELGDVHADFIDRRFEVEALFQEAMAAARKDATRVTAGQASVFVVPIEYLVALKMVGVRPQDEADVAHLLKLQDLDYSKTRRIVDNHLGGVAARFLDKAARQAGRTDARDAYDEP